MMAAFWAAVTVLIVWAIRTSGNPVQSVEDRAIGILDERLARGEVDSDEYEERRQLIESHR